MTSINAIIQAINQVLVNLSPDQQQEVLDFAEFLQAKPSQSSSIQAEKSKATLVQELRELFKELQSIPEIQEMTEEEIIAEVNAYRQGE